MAEKKTINIPKKIIAIIAVIIIVIVALICRAILNEDSGKSNNAENYKLPIEYYYSGIQNKDFDTFLKAYPDFMQVSSLISSDDLNDYYEQYTDECGENVSMSYEIGETVALSAEELQQLTDDINTMYGMNINLTEAYKIEIKETYSGDQSSVEENKKHTVIKYNEQWYTL